MKIKSKKFILRPFRRGDEQSLVKNISDKTIYRNTSNIPYPYTLKDAKDWLRKNLKEAKKKKPTKINFVIDVHGEVMGSVGLDHIEGHKAEIGYWLSQRLRGKGIMTEAVRLVTRYGFSSLKLRRIYATVFYFNRASMRVLEKGGYKFEGVLRKYTKKGRSLLDVHLYAKIR